jgi:hypothetical protein
MPATQRSSSEPDLRGVSYAKAVLGPVYRTRDENLLSPSPYPSSSSTSGSEIAKAADTSTDPTSTPQDDAGSTLSSQIAILGILDKTKDKSPVIPDRPVPCPQVNIPVTVNAQPNAGDPPSTVQSSTANCMIVNGVKSIPEQPTKVIPATISNAGNAQQIQGQTASYYE